VNISKGLYSKNEFLIIMDYVYPSGNEKEFVKMAEYLEIEALCFIYKLKEAVDLSKIKTNIKIFIGTQITSINEIKKVNSKPNIIFYRNISKIRDILYKPVDIVVGMENVPRKDFLHHRNSGLNHIICNIAKEKNKSFGFSFSDVLSIEAKYRARLLGRIRQNVRLCRKSGIEIIYGSFAKEPHEMRKLDDIKLLFKIS